MNDDKKPRSQAEIEAEDIELVYLKRKQYTKRLTRPKFELTDELLKEIEVLGGHGATLETIRIYYDVEKKYFARLCARNSRIADALLRGQTKMTLSIAGKIVEQARAGNVSAATFYLKTQGGAAWRQMQIIGLAEPPRDKLIPSKLGTDPIEASRIYQEIMK